MLFRSPLRILIDAEREEDILHSFILMSEQMDSFWLPTFPEITGDSRRMNSNHGVISILDAHVFLILIRKISSVGRTL